MDEGARKLWRMGSIKEKLLETLSNPFKITL